MRTEYACSKPRKNANGQRKKMVDFAFAGHVVLLQAYMLQSEFDHDMKAFLSSYLDWIC